MNTPNIIQYAPLFDAAGAKINLVTSNLSCEIAEYPKNKKTVIDNAVSDISRFLDTRTYVDGMAIWAIADSIDGIDNPLSRDSRNAILTALGLVKEGKYIYQVLATAKINKSWHTSEEPNECTYFGEMCTHRGSVDVKGKRGRKATRLPNEYHPEKSNGIINREQLTTPSIEALWHSIPDGTLVAASKPKTTFRLDEIASLKPEELAELMDRINKVQASAT